MNEKVEVWSSRDDVVLWYDGMYCYERDFPYGD